MCPSSQVIPPPPVGCSCPELSVLSCHLLRSLPSLAFPSTLVSPPWQSVGFPPQTAAARKGLWDCTSNLPSPGSHRWPQGRCQGYFLCGPLDSEAAIDSPGQTQAFPLKRLSTRQAYRTKMNVGAVGRGAMNICWWQQVHPWANIWRQSNEHRLSYVSTGL